MIIKTFDNGWGRQYPLKQYEQSITQSLLRQFESSAQRIVLINSVWYTDDYHSEVTAWLDSNQWDQIVLVAMLDAAIPQPDWYAKYNKPVTGLGYYPGPGQVDFCALFVDKFLAAPDADNLLDHNKIDMPFMCLMRKPHGHRKKLFWKLKQADLLGRALVSMGSEDGKAWSTLPVDTGPDNLAPNADVTHYGIPNDIVSLGHLDNWSRHFVNVVAETFYDINQNNFVSEKIYKPIVGCRPFLVFAPDGARQWLVDRKFEPYARDFGDICDLDPFEPEHLVRFLKILSDQPRSYWQAKLVDLKPKILYNRQRFREYVAEQQLIVQQGITCQI